MDLSNLKPVEREVEITNPANGEPVGIRVSVMSIDDPRLKAQKRAIRNEANRAASRGKYIKAEQEEENSNALLFAATTGWTWYNPTGEEGDKNYDASKMPQFDGEVLDYNQRNFIKIVKELPWFATQLVAEIDEEKAFFTN